MCHHADNLGFPSASSFACVLLNFLSLSFFCLQDILQKAKADAAALDAAEAFYRPEAGRERAAGLLYCRRGEL